MKVLRMKRKMHTNKDRLVELLVEGMSALARVAPETTALTMGRMLGALACRIAVRQRRVAEINMAFAFKEALTQNQITQMVRRNFQQWAMIALEWGKANALDLARPGHFPFTIQVKGQAHWQAAKAQSPAILLLSAHFGNWEFAHVHYATVFNRLNFIVRRIDNAYIEARRSAFNARHNVNILYKKNGLKPAILNLKKGEDLVIFADQNVNAEEGSVCRFFGRKTSTLSVVAALAKKYNLPVLPMFSVRKGAGPVHQLTFLEPLTIAPNDSVQTIAQMQNDAIEKMVRAYPDHWLWMHRKWKHYHPEIYAGL